MSHPHPIFAPGARTAGRRPPTGAGSRPAPGAPWAIEVAVAKVAKYASAESGDTVEVTERPHGGLSVVLADGQGSGRAAKALSNLVAKKAISLLADGTRDGAAARAVHDFLFAYRHGQVSTELAIVSADLVTHSVVVSRNTHCPALLAVAGPGDTDRGVDRAAAGGWPGAAGATDAGAPGRPGRAAAGGAVESWDEPAPPIGLYPNTKPLIRELPVAAGTTTIVYSDGIHDAGQRTGRPFDAAGTVAALVAAGASAQELADALLAGAIAADGGRPGDDMTVAVLAIRAAAAPDGARRLAMQFPIG